MMNRSLKQFGEMLQTKKISSVELTQTFLARIAQHNPSINADVYKRQLTHQTILRGKILGDILV